MNYTLVFSKHADQDLLDILQYTLDNFGEHQYWIYRSLLKEAVDLITGDPKHVASRSREELCPGARTYHIEQPSKKASHFLLYRINEEKAHVELGRILHEKVDLRRHIPDDFKKQKR